MHCTIEDCSPSINTQCPPNMKLHKEPGVCCKKCIEGNIIIIIIIVVIIISLINKIICVMVIEFENKGKNGEVRDLESVNNARARTHTHTHTHTHTRAHVYQSVITRLTVTTKKRFSF